MPRRWTTVPLPAMGSGGEAGDAAPGLVPVPAVRLMRNMVIVGPGAVRQQPDWLLADTLENLAVEEGHAVCGIFPFATQGGAAAASAGVAFSFNSDDNAILIHQLDEQGAVMRTLVALSSYLESLPPQITGFEMFGRFYFVAYGREAAADRKGFSYFDPTGAGSVATDTFDLVSGGVAAAALRFRGISKHRGSTIFGWGYRNEEAGEVDVPHSLRYNRYGEPDTWVPDLTDQSAGFINIGSLGIPIVACAMSGQYTIVGKETEVFALDGEFSSEFYYRRIGTAHGPVSTAGIAEAGSMAAWMGTNGPAVSVNGGLVELLALDRIEKRFLSYLDLTNAWACHDAPRNRIVWGLRRKEDEDGNVVSSLFLTELLWWDYVRNRFGVSGLPAPIFSIGMIRGPGVDLPGPAGASSGHAASNITSAGARITWTPGDEALDVTSEVEFRVNGGGSYLSAGTTPPATYYRDITGLVPSTLYDVRERQVRNGQVSAWVEALALFTTAATPAVPDPAAPTVAETGETSVIKGKTYAQVEMGWTPFETTGVRVHIWRAFDGVNFSDKGNAAPQAGRWIDPQHQQTGLPVYYQLRTEAVGDPAVGNFVNCTPYPITPSGVS